MWPAEKILIHTWDTTTYNLIHNRGMTSWDTTTVNKNSCWYKCISSVNLFFTQIFPSFLKRGRKNFCSPHSAENIFTLKILLNGGDLFPRRYAENFSPIFVNAEDEANINPVVSLPWRIIPWSAVSKNDLTNGQKTRDLWYRNPVCSFVLLNSLTAYSNNRSQFRKGNSFFAISQGKDER